MVGSVVELGGSVHGKLDTHREGEHAYAYHLLVSSGPRLLGAAAHTGAGRSHSGVVPHLSHPCEAPLQTHTAEPDDLDCLSFQLLTVRTMNSLPSVLLQ